MDKQFNGLLHRSSIMHTWWLLQACIVLAGGLWLVSCTKDQKDHRAQPAPFSQSLNPCQPAGVRYRPFNVRARWAQGERSADWFTVMRIFMRCLPCLLAHTLVANPPSSFQPGMNVVEAAGRPSVLRALDG
jgi:hypothetical protein